MTTITIEREEDLRVGSFNATAIAAPVTCVGDLDQSDGLWSSLKPGEHLVTGKFFSDGISVGKEYVVRAIGEKRYAKFIGRLKRIKQSYGWVLTFEDENYISSDGSLVPVKNPDLATIFPKESTFKIYADSTPSGYGLQECPD